MGRVFAGMGSFFWRENGRDCAHLVNRDGSDDAFCALSFSNFEPLWVHRQYGCYSRDKLLGYAVDFGGLFDGSFWVGRVLY